MFAPEAPGQQYNKGLTCVIPTLSGHNRREKSYLAGTRGRSMGTRRAGIKGDSDVDGITFAANDSARNALHLVYRQGGARRSAGASESPFITALSGDRRPSPADGRFIFIAVKNPECFHVRPSSAPR
ncbi:hypothetical protein EVAR_84393_1 [Eumeta japonica]|uniref:Uncharacterized protein n=1 Tax=Eumeta variegata TaxID=151549 RepID=A0A4C1YD83_EUMVA|nr:hypothetical protein EVAR_84393_1 [Eumeta japonica]